LAEVVLHVTCSWEVPVSNFGWVGGYSFSLFSSFPPGWCQNSIPIRTHFLPYIFWFITG